VLTFIQNVEKNILADQTTPRFKELVKLIIKEKQLLQNNLFAPTMHKPSVLVLIMLRTQQLLNFDGKTPDCLLRHVQHYKTPPTWLIL
jgi:hypothetical protein